MPLLGNKVHVLNHVTSLENLPSTVLIDSFKSDEAGDKRFFIGQSSEQCQSEEEFLMKTFLYNQKIWTCRCSLKSGLTWREALKSEVSMLKELKNKIPIYFERSILASVHHQNGTLDGIIHEAFLTLHGEFCINEPVELNASKAGKKSIKGVIVRIDRSQKPIEANGITSTSQDNPSVELKPGDSGKKEKSGKKMATNTPSKSDHRYMVKIASGQMVSGIPASVLVRQVRPPTKEQIRNLIRSHCWRLDLDSNGPFVVEEMMLKKYSIPDKIDDAKINMESFAEFSRKVEVETYLKKTRKKKCKNSPKKSKTTAKKLVHSISIISNDKDTDPSNQTEDVKQVTIYSTPGDSSTSRSKRTKPIKQLSPSKVKSLCHTKGKTAVTKKSQAAIRKLVQAHSEGRSTKVFSKLAANCGRLCNQSQIDGLSDELRSKVMVYKDRFDLKNKLDKMTPEQLKDYRLQRRKIVLQRMDQKRHERNHREEDSTIHSDKDLPQPQPLTDLPEGVSVSQWMQCLGFTEMLYSMQGLLRQYSGKRSFKLVSVERLVQGLVNKEVVWITNLLEIVLRTMLQDDSLAKVCELNFGLLWSQITMNRNNVTEILRLVLETQIQESAALAETKYSPFREEVEEFPEQVLEDCIERKAKAGSSAVAYEIVSSEMIKVVENLKNVEFYDVPFNEKLLILELIKIRFLNLTVVNNYFEDLNRISCESFKTKMDLVKVTKDLKKALPAFQQMRKQDGENSVDEDPEKALAEVENKLSTAEKEWRVVSNNTKNALRLGSIGVDRYHRRYWIFRTSPPGVYLEQIEDENRLDYSHFNCNHNHWFVFNTEESLEELLDLLHDHGIREHNLKVELKKTLPSLKLSLEKYHESKCNNKDSELSFSKEDDQSQSTIVTQSNSNENNSNEYLKTSKKTLINEFIYFIISLYSNRLLDLPSLPDWLEKSKNPDQSLSEFQELLIDTSKHLLIPLSSKSTLSNSKSVDDHVDSKLDSELSALDQWQTDILYANTVSRLSFLQNLLEVCIKLKHSIQVPQCFLCEGKFSKCCDYIDVQLLVCSRCHKLAHTACLNQDEQPLQNSSINDWLCAPCRVKKFSAERKPSVRAPKTITISMTDLIVDSESVTPKETPENSGRIRKKNIRYADSDYEISSIGEEASSHSRSVSRLSNNASNKNSSNDKSYSPKQKLSRRSTDRSNNRSAKRPASSTSFPRKSRVSKRRAIDSFSIRGSPTKRHSAESDSSWSYDSPDESCSSVSKDSDKEDNFCLKLIDTCLKHRSSSYFRELVDADEVPDYYDIVSDPVSLSIIQDRLLNSNYGHGRHCLTGVLSDLKLLFGNARLYNAGDSEVVDQAKKLESFMLSVLARSNHSYSYEREFG